MTTTDMIVITTIRPPTAPPTVGPMDTSADSGLLVTGNVEVEIMVLCVDMPVTESVAVDISESGGTSVRDDSFIGTSA